MSETAAAAKAKSTIAGLDEMLASHHPLELDAARPGDTRNAETLACPVCQSGQLVWTWQFSQPDFKFGALVCRGCRQAYDVTPREHLNCTYQGNRLIPLTPLGEKEAEMTVRGKFKVTEITRNAWNPDGAQVKLEAVYTGTPEDNTYSAATPSATIQMTITNPKAIDSLPLGKSFYVDFTPTEV